jgi:hypothetical protein
MTLRGGAWRDAHRAAQPGQASERDRHPRPPARAPVRHLLAEVYPLAHPERSTICRAISVTDRRSVEMRSTQEGVLGGVRCRSRAASSRAEHPHLSGYKPRSSPEWYHHRHRGALHAEGTLGVRHHEPCRRRLVPGVDQRPRTSSTQTGCAPNSGSTRRQRNFLTAYVADV